MTHRSPKRTVALVAAGLAALAVTAGAAAFAQMGRGPIVHEFVPPLASDVRVRSRSGPQGGRPGSSQPGAIHYEDQTLPEPQVSEQLESDERVVGAPSSESVLRPFDSFRPDRDTRLDGELEYFEVFTPSIAPFKRVTALDAVETDYRLVVADRTLLPVPVVGADAASPDARPRDVFWASLVVELSARAPTPLPSVSPESRILSYRTAPETSLRFFRDGADNFYVRGASGRVRIVMLTDAPRSYFGTEIREHAPTDLYGAQVRPIPPNVARAAAVVAQSLGVSSQAPIRQTLDTLVGHFRAFVESDVAPRGNGDIYVDLALGQKGVCRHRAFAFMVTANALGVPTRMVQNEAHAWVEVRLPIAIGDDTLPGWVRIDLGGAAQGLTSHNADDRPPYRPDVTDTLPQPEAYQRAYSRVEGDRSSTEGGAEGQAAEARSQRTGTLDPSASPAQGAAGGGTEGDERRAGIEGQGTTEADPDADRRTPLVIEVTADATEVLRGHDVRVRGRLGVALEGAGGAAEESLEGMRVEIVLVGADDLRARMLGVTSAHEGGAFELTATVSPDLPVGEYVVRASTPGDDTHRPARSR